MATLNIQETTLGSVFGAPGDPNGGIFIGKLGGVSGKVMRRRLLYPTYKNSTGKNQIVKNSLNEEYLYNEEGSPLTGADIEMICELGLTNRLSFSGGKFVQIEPKCAAFPYCNQGAIDKPIKLIGQTKEGMCEGCYDYCTKIGEAAGKTPEYIAEGFRNYAFKKLEEITRDDKQKLDQLVNSIKDKVDPKTMEKIETNLSAAIIDPYITFNDLFNRVKQFVPNLFSEGTTIEEVDNKKLKTINEMIKVKSLPIEKKKAVLETLKSSDVAECMQTKLQTEGFLPSKEELTEGMTLESSMNIMMEDEEIVNDMFESLLEGDCKCSKNIKEWMNENNPFGDEEETEKPGEEEVMGDNVPTDTPEETPTEPESSEPSTQEPENNPEEDSLQTAVDKVVTDDSEVAIGVPAGDLDTLIDQLVSLQTKYSGDADQSEILGQINGMLNQAKAIKGTVETTGADITGADSSSEEPAEADVDVSVADTIAEDINGGLDVPVDTAVQGPTKAGTRKTFDVDFTTKLNKFIDVYLDDIKWNSFKHYFRFAPEIQPEDLKSYFKPSQDETGLAYVIRITDIQNDPTGFNRMLMNMMNPAKRGYLQKFGSKYNPEYIDSLEDLLSEMWNKYLSIQTQLNGTHSPLDNDDETEPDNEVDPYAKDDFEKDFIANDDDNVHAQADTAATSSAPLPVDIGPEDLGDEDDEILEGEMKPLMGKNVLADNEKAAQETVDQAKDAVASQDTEDKKVEDLKNQKFEKSEAQNTIAGKLHGMNNNLDLDYDTELTDEQKERILNQASGEVPEDHANVDHDSTAGQDLINAAKERQEQNTQQYTSLPDQTKIAKSDKYQVTTAVNEDIERMRKLMSFDVTKLKENSLRKKINEDKILIDKVQKKKFL